MRIDFLMMALLISNIPKNLWYTRFRNRKGGITRLPGERFLGQLVVIDEAGAATLHLLNDGCN
ncbi:hypothetical protein CYPRO_2420 [Cyclonatronum proteinivorum]|uniref:Uncharacterized protein n=1 Tax=Cyclonatronum proteinivorum TaxID=1457365 RepID=A0A345UMG0_9BACT|nr:hypothetical protein CYPRO_2420 [Cyclonatronum proteinivorum]